MEKVNDPRMLFDMLQCLREVIASETGDKAKFKFMTPDGKIHEVSSKEEADKIGREYGRGDIGNRTKQG